MSDAPSSSEAERLYAEKLAELRSGDAVDIDAACKAHPQLEEDLRRLHADWLSVRGVLDRLGLSGSISARLEAEFGSEVDPGVELESENGDDSSEFTTEVLTRLAERKGAFGRYKLKAEVARGGQGAVLRVWDEDLRRNLAMKVILGKGDAAPAGTPRVDSRTLGRFLEEAQVTGQLDHPGIVPVHELGLDSEGRVYFTMKLVKGRSFKEIIDLVHSGDEQWTLTRALGVLLKVCEAMTYAHAKGVIHRDLKPANVMVGRYGEVYAMDWGLARVLGQEDKKDIRIRTEGTTTPSEIRSDRKEHDDTPDSPLLTMDGDVVGTPAYMSPEQARGELDQVGPLSDVYSVGAMLYELLTGRMPYVGPGVRINNYAVWSLVQAGPPERLERAAPDAPVEMAAICERAMARDAQERYQEMDALARDLRSFLEGRVVSAYERGAIPELKKWIRRNRALAASLAAGILVLLVGMTTSVILKDRADRNATLAAERELDARKNHALAEERRKATENALVLAESRREALEASNSELVVRRREAEEATRRTEDALLLETALGLVHQTDRFEAAFSRVSERILAGESTAQDRRRFALAYLRPQVEAEPIQSLGNVDFGVRLRSAAQGVSKELGMLVLAHVEVDGNPHEDFNSSFGVVFSGDGAGAGGEGGHFESHSLARHRISGQLEVLFGRVRDPGHWMQAGPMLAREHSSVIEILCDPIEMPLEEAIVTVVPEAPRLTERVHDAGPLPLSFTDEVSLSVEEDGLSDNGTRLVLEMPLPPVVTSCRMRLVEVGNAVGAEPGIPAELSSQSRMPLGTLPATFVLAPSGYMIWPTDGGGFGRGDDLSLRITFQSDSRDLRLVIEHDDDALEHYLSQSPVSRSTVHTYGRVDLVLDVPGRD